MVCHHVAALWRACVRAQQVIVFILGGSTYEEAKAVAEWNDRNPQASKQASKPPSLACPAGRPAGAFSACACASGGAGSGMGFAVHWAGKQMHPPHTHKQGPQTTLLMHALARSTAPTVAT